MPHICHPSHPREGTSFSVNPIGSLCAGYTLELVRIADITDGGSIVPFSDGTEIWLGTWGDKGTLAATLDRGDRWTGNLTSGQCVWTNNKRISGSSERGSTDAALIPLWVKGRTLGFTMSRYNGTSFQVFPLADGAGTITLDGVVQATPTFTAGQWYEHNTGSVAAALYQGTWELVADVDCLAYKTDQDRNADSSAVFPPTTDLLGWASTSFYFGPSGAVGSLWSTSDLTPPHVQTVATTGFAAVNGGTLSGGTSSYYHPEAGLRCTLDQPGYGHSRADADGGSDTAAFPTSWAKRIHVIPHETEFISFVSEFPAAITQINEQTGATVSTFTLTRTASDPMSPYAARVGTPDNSENFDWGQRFESADPFVCVYQPKGTGDFGSDDDETESFGYNPGEL